MNIYVGNLPFSVLEDDIRAAFAAYGTVASVSIIKDKFTGESRGFAFVEMPNGQEAQAAISALNGQPMKGRTLTVNEARPREERGSGGPRREGGGGGGGGSGARRGPDDRRGGGGGRGGSSQGGRSGGGDRGRW